MGEGVIVVGHGYRSTGMRVGAHLCDACGLPEAAHGHVRHRFNVGHLSVHQKDHHFLWRSSLDGTLIMFGRWPELPFSGFWGAYRGEGKWSRLANVTVFPRPGERFIRVGAKV